MNFEAATFDLDGTLLSSIAIFMIKRATAGKQPRAKMIQKTAKILPNQRLNLPNSTVGPCGKHIAGCIV